MKVYIVFDGDHIGRLVGRATLDDKPDEVRQLSQRIDQGNLIFRMWAESFGGNVINIGGDEGRLEVEATRLHELPGIREQYEGAVGATCSVGVGMQLSLAQKALVAAKAKGGDQIMFYSHEVDLILAELEEKSEGSKIADEYLNKADQGSGGMAPQHKLVGGHAGDSSEVDTLMGILNGDDQDQPQAEQPHAAVEGPDMEDMQNQFHKLAGSNQQTQPQPASVSDAVKAKIVQVIEFMQTHPEQLQMLQVRNPELYNSINTLVSAMIEMARKQTPEQQQAEQQPQEGLGKKDLMPGGQGDDLPDSDFDPESLKRGVAAEMKEHGLDEARAKEIAKDHLVEDPNYYDLDKASLEAGLTGRHNVILPVGTTKEPSAQSTGRAHDLGRRKVQTADGKEHWVSVRAGIVMSPGGQATSSRNPSGIKPADEQEGQQ